MIESRFPWQRLERSFAEWTGIDLRRGGTHTMIAQFVSDRVAALGLKSADTYLDLVCDAAQAERQRLIDAATIGLTWFFRDDEQLRMVAQWLRERPPSSEPARIWIAGCSSGEDAYSVAMLAETVGRSVDILGTDINSALLTRAQSGQFGKPSLRSLPDEQRRWLSPTADGRHQVTAELRRNVRFGRHNLLDTPPHPVARGEWDLILCRNVLIYFEPALVPTTVSRLARALSDDGVLLLGASEMAGLSLPDDIAMVLIGSRHALRRRRIGDARDVSLATTPAVMIAPAPAPATARSQARRSPMRAPAPPSAASSSADASLPSRTPAGRLARAHDALHAGRLASAIELYREILAADPLSIEALMCLGIALHKDDQIDAAAHALRGALFLEGDLWPAAFYLALCHERLGNPVEAAREYRRVVDCAARPMAMRASILGDIETWKSEVVAVARDYLSRLGPR